MRAEGAADGGLPPVGSSLNEVERVYIAKTLEKAGGNKTRTAKTLGIGLKTLYRKIEKYNIET